MDRQKRIQLRETRKKRCVHNKKQHKKKKLNGDGCTACQNKRLTSSIKLLTIGGNSVECFTAEMFTFG